MTENEHTTEAKAGRVDEVEEMHVARLTALGRHQAETLGDIFRHPLEMGMSLAPYLDDEERESWVVLGEERARRLIELGYAETMSEVHLAQLETEARAALEAADRADEAEAVQGEVTADDDGEGGEAGEPTGAPPADVDQPDAPPDLSAGMAELVTVFEAAVAQEDVEALALLIESADFAKLAAAADPEAVEAFAELARRQMPPEPSETAPEEPETPETPPEVPEPPPEPTEGDTEPETVE